MPARSKPMSDLRQCLPPGYIKKVLNEIDFHPSENYVYLVANGKRKNPEIEQILYWMALEHMLKTILFNKLGNGKS